MQGATALCLLLALSTTAFAFYLPGTAPREFQDGDHVDMQVNVLSSVNTHLPFDYYSLPHCLPTKKFRGEPENLGEILLGDRIKPSPYEELYMAKDVQCKPVCAGGAKRLDGKAQKKIKERVKQEYHVNLIVDNLPLAVTHPDTGTFSVGIPLGVVESNTAYLYNHIHFTIRYHETPVVKPDGTESITKRIVAFVGRPMSIRHDGESCVDGKLTAAKLGPQKVEENDVLWTYGVTWERSDERWATRWDVYLNVSDHEIHWYSIINSVLIVLFLSGLVALIMIRSLRKDINKYNRIELDPEDLQEETGWKLVHKDVFRPPPIGWLLASHAGTGVQLLGMSVTVLVFACLGFLSPANRGSLFTAALVCFVFLGMYAGYTAARLLKLWGTPSWKHIFITGTFVPGVCFSLFFVINLFVWHQGSTAAVPFPTMLAVIAMWFCISLPLVFVGAVLGYKRETLSIPVPVNQIPRHIPETNWHMNPYFTVLMGGILPFGAVFIEVFFILTAVWLNRYYYVFGFLALVFIILTITCAEITIVMVYFQLCAEDYRWWWRSFLTSGSCGLYLFFYAIFYFFTSSLRMTSFVPILLYFGYMGLLSYVFFVMTGTVGFIAAFWFSRTIYGSIKID